MSNINNSSKSVLPKYEPSTWIYLAGFIYLSCILASTWLITQQAYLGLGLKASPEMSGLQVTEVNTIGSSNLKIGDQLIAITGKDNRHSLLSALSVMEEPDNFKTYPQYNQFIAHQQALNTILSQELVEVVLADGQSIEIVVAPSRPISHLPYQYWLLLVVAGIGFYIGLWLWVFRRGQIVARLIAVSGFGFMLGACGLAVYTNRELVIDPVHFKLLSTVNHLGNILFVSSSLAILCYYPSKIANKPFVAIIFIMMLSVWLNETLQYYEVPIHTFYVLPYFATSILGLIAGRWQWQQHKNNPVARASIRWFLLTLTLCIGSTLALYFIPALFDEAPLLPVWVAQIIMLMLYIGLVLGVVQYRLFDVEQWWFNCWIWFFSGCCVIAMDILLMYFFNITPLQSISAAVLLIAWCYFPLRQWLWAKTIHPQCTHLENFLPLLTEAYISSPSIKHFEHSWPDLLAKIYRPLSVKVHASVIDTVSLTDQGLSIVLPSLDNQKYIELSGLERGAKLFSMQDVHFIESALVYARNCINWKSVREEGAIQERERIRRDLHDDVGALLLTLVHLAESEENAELARRALKGVRDSIYSLRYDNFSTLETALPAWRVEIKQRTDAAFVDLQWHIDEVPSDYWLNPRQRINLDRILREAITNILKHARPKTINIGINAHNDELQMVITDDGQSSDYAEWQANTGLYNLQTRAQEIKAQLSWISLNDSEALASGTMLTITLPSMEKKTHAFHPDCR
ncbi:MAG: two-component system, NarL family, sensor histidine kinase DevS [Methyloprofundus sp.]|nr:MAG: two-component system, NarL family, sensor histidine kinase DevS [Methyloprofundus sp.]